MDLGNLLLERRAHYSRNFKLRQDIFKISRFANKDIILSGIGIYYFSMQHTYCTYNKGWLPYPCWKTPNYLCAKFFKSKEYSIRGVPRESRDQKVAATLCLRDTWDLSAFLDGQNLWQRWQRKPPVSTCLASTWFWMVVR